MGFLRRFSFKGRRFVSKWVISPGYSLLYRLALLLSFSSIDLLIFERRDTVGKATEPLVFTRMEAVVPVSCPMEYLVYCRSGYPILAYQVPDTDMILKYLSESSFLWSGVSFVFLWITVLFPKIVIFERNRSINFCKQRC